MASGSSSSSTGRWTSDTCRKYLHKGEGATLLHSPRTVGRKKSPKKLWEASPNLRLHLQCPMPDITHPSSRYSSFWRTEDGFTRDGPVSHLHANNFQAEHDLEFGRLSSGKPIHTGSCLAEEEGEGLTSSVAWEAF